MKPFPYSRFTALLLDSFSEPQAEEKPKKTEDAVTVSEGPKEKKEKSDLKKVSQKSENKVRKKRKPVSKHNKKNQRLYCSKCRPRVEACCLVQKMKPSKTNMKQLKNKKK